MKYKHTHRCVEHYKRIWFFGLVKKYLKLNIFKINIYTISYFVPSI